MSNKNIIKNLKINRKLRRLGAAKNIGVFAALHKVGGEQLTLSFKNAYNLFIQTGSRQARSKYERLQTQMLELVKELPRNERVACYRLLHHHYIAVVYRDSNGGKVALEGIIDAIKKNPHITDTASEQAAYLLKEVQKVHPAASGLIKKMGENGPYSKHFQNVFQKFFNKVPLDSEELQDVYEGIIKYCKNGDLARREKFLNRLQGRLFEKYTEKSKLWKNEFTKRKKEAQQIADQMGNGWDVEDVVGELYLLGNPSFKEAWDAAIIIKNEETKQAFLFTAGQFKAEKRLKGLKQTKNEALWRETDAVSPRTADRSEIPTMVRFQKNRKQMDYQLIPTPSNTSTHRYVINTSGTKIPTTDEEALKQFGISVHQLELDVSALQMRALADAMVSAVMDVLR